MSAATLDIVIEQGATFFRTFTITENGSALDITNYVVRAMVRKNYEDQNPVVAFTTNITNPTNGVFTIELTAIVTAAITGLGNRAVDHRWDLEYEDTSNVVTRLVQGTATITPEVTK